MMEIFIGLRGCLAFSMLAPSFSEINRNPGKQEETSVELKELPLGRQGRPGAVRGRTKVTAAAFA